MRLLVLSFILGGSLLFGQQSVRAAPTVEPKNNVNAAVKIAADISSKISTESLGDTEIEELLTMLRSKLRKPETFPVPAVSSISDASAKSGSQPHLLSQIKDVLSVFKEHQKNTHIANATTVRPTTAEKRDPASKRKLPNTNRTYTSAKQEAAILEKEIKEYTKIVHNLFEKTVTLLEDFQDSPLLEELIKRVDDGIIHIFSGIINRFFADNMPILDIVIRGFCNVTENSGSEQERNAVPDLYSEVDDIFEMTQKHQEVEHSPALADANGDGETVPVEIISSVPNLTPVDSQPILEEDKSQYPSHEIIVESEKISDIDYDVEVEDEEVLSALENDRLFLVGGVAVDNSAEVKTGRILTQVKADQSASEIEAKRKDEQETLAEIERLKKLRLMKLQKIMLTTEAASESEEVTEELVDEKWMDYDTDVKYDDELETRFLNQRPRSPDDYYEDVSTIGKTVDQPKEVNDPNSVNFISKRREVIRDGANVSASVHSHNIHPNNSSNSKGESRSQKYSQKMRTESPFDDYEAQSKSENDRLLTTDYEKRVVHENKRHGPLDHIPKTGSRRHLHTAWTPYNTQS